MLRKAARIRSLQILVRQTDNQQTTQLTPEEPAFQVVFPLIPQFRGLVGGARAAIKVHDHGKVLRSHPLHRVIE